jgi:pimeloyl-ACP methyl ester carboxylesterase
MEALSHFSMKPKLVKSVISKDGTSISYEAREREIDDLAALLEAAGGSAAVAGLSSGAALALEAAASGLNITKLAAYEPPYVSAASAASGRPEADHEANLKRLLSEGGPGDAVKYFMRDMMGAPGFVVLLMRLMPGSWRQLQAVAHTRGA